MQHHKRYGYRRVCIQLHNEGYTINHKTVQKLMQGMHLKSVVRRVRYRSYKGQVGRIAANVLERDFTAQVPNSKWATDVTEFKIGDKKAYLSPILDMYNGEIISYTISDCPDLRMVMKMINGAILNSANQTYFPVASFVDAWIETFLTSYVLVNKIIFKLLSLFLLRCYVSL